jgi:hypothetical protein
MAKLFISARKRRAFLVHVDEDLAETAVVIFAGAQIHLVAADRPSGCSPCGGSAFFAFAHRRSMTRSTMRSATSAGRRRLGQRLDRVILVLSSSIS